MDAIDILEKRIAALELKVLPAENSADNSSTVTDMLLQINTLIASALSCREVISTTLDRMAELNNYLDPNYYENILSTDVKRQYILSLYDEVKKYVESLQKIKNLYYVLDSAPIKNTESLIVKLEQLNLDNMKLENENAMLTKNIANSLQQYNNIIYSISCIFVKLEEIISQLEIKMNAKTNKPINE